MGYDPLAVYKMAVSGVPAYPTFLRESLGAIPEVESLEDFRKLPTTDKHGYIARFPLEAICLDGTLRGKHVICRSSGTSGHPVYWPQLPEQERDSVRWVMSDFEELLHVREAPALAVVALGLGPWISGELASWSLRSAAIEGGCITLATPGYNLDVAVEILGRFGPHFAQTVLLSYPPFAKAIIEGARGLGTPVESLRVSLRLVGEGYSEHYRDYMMRLLGYEERDAFRIWAGYASTDFGRAGKESPVAVACRRLLHKSGLVEQILGTSVIPSICQFDPESFYLEVVDGELVITRHQGVPLVRYRTGDRGQLLAFEEMMGRFLECGLSPLETVKSFGFDERSIRRLPFVLVEGRMDGGVTFFGANIIVEQIRDCIESNASLTEQVTGAFQIFKTQDASLNPVLELRLERRGGAKGADAAEVARVVAKELASRSTEYAMILGQEKERALPIVSFVEEGALLKGNKVHYVNRE